MEPKRTPRRALGALTLAALLAGSGACTRPTAAAPVRSYIVALRGDAPPDAIADERGRRRGVSVSHKLRSALRGFVASMPEDEARDLAADPRVSYVEPDGVLEVQAQTTPTGVARIGAPANAAPGLDGRDDRGVDATVAVVDSGVDGANGDLEVVAGVDCIGGVCRPGGDEDDFGHGTHVAGIIGARDDGNGVVGVAPGVRIVPVKVIGDQPTGKISDGVAGLDWVAANSASIEVVNLSIGGRGVSQALTDAVTNLVDRGVVVVVAAGNGPGGFGADVRAYTPANLPDVITVSALADYDGRAGGVGSAPAGCTPAGRDDRLATFSNWGPGIDMAAPGVCIESLEAGGGTKVVNGTSFAAPHVAGAAALLASRSRAHDRAGVLALRDRLVTAGTSDWTDTSPDGIKEPLVNVADPDMFAPAPVS
jgi:subtilisin family serine protease